MKNSINLIFIFSLLFTTFSCNNNSLSPNNEEQPGRRDYVWTVDTLNYPYTAFDRLWGSSPEDIWITGSGGNNSNTILHFDGNLWSKAKFPIPPYWPRGIFGFGKDNIYIGFLNAGIWHFDGNALQQFANLTKNGHDDLIFDNLWGFSSNDFYAFGAYPDSEGYARNSVIAHYYNGKWDMLNTDNLYGIVEHLYKNSFDNKIYIQVIGGHNYTDSTTIWEYDGGKYQKLYSNIWITGLQADISYINSEVYFIIKDEILKRSNGQFQTVVKIDNPNFTQNIWGRNGRDIFLMMTDGLAHYNGNNVEYLFHYAVRTQIFGAALFSNDVFFLIYEPNSGLGLIYHGILKQ